MLTELKEAKRGYKEYYSKVDWKSCPWDYPTIFVGYRNILVKREVVNRIPATTKCLLDLGCGYGHLGDLLAKAGKLRGYVGVDICLYMLKMAKAKLNGLPLGLVLGVGEFLPFREGSFDVIVCCEALEYVVNQKKVVNEMSKASKFGGLIIIATGRKEWAKEWIKHFPLTYPLLVVSWIKARKRGWYVPKGVHDVPPSEKELRHFITTLGLKILEHERMIFLPPFHGAIPYTPSTISLYRRLNQMGCLQKLRRVQLLTAVK